MQSGLSDCMLDMQFKKLKLHVHELNLLMMSVTVHHASGLQRPRVSVLCVHAGTGQTDVGQQEPSLTLQARPLASPVGDGRTADTPGIDPDYEQDAQDSVTLWKWRRRECETC